VSGIRLAGRILYRCGVTATKSLILLEKSPLIAGFFFMCYDTVSVDNLGAFMSVIYRITCVENGKFYIGSTVNRSQRWSRHRRELRLGQHKNQSLQASWNKYGESSFIFEVVEEVPDVLQLMAVEQRWLDQFVGHRLCFNFNRFADAPWRGKTGAATPRWGVANSPETRAKISAAISGENHPNWGKQLRPETRAKISASQEANPWRGANHTPEAIAKIAAASRGRPVSPEARAKRRAALMGHEVSSVTRAKISATLSGEGNYWYGKKRPDHGEKVSKKVWVTQPDGTRTLFESISALREALSLKPPTVNRALKAGTPVQKGAFKGWLFQYAVT
jgi:group I intron endonuclease